MDTFTAVPASTGHLRGKPSLCSGTKQVPAGLVPHFAEQKCLHNVTLSTGTFTRFLSSIMAGRYKCTFYSLIQTLSYPRPSFLVDLFLIKRAWWLFSITSQIGNCLSQQVVLLSVYKYGPFFLEARYCTAPGSCFLASHLDCQLLTHNKIDSALAHVSQTQDTVLVMRQKLNKACIFPFADCDICYFPVQSYLSLEYVQDIAVTYLVG